MYVTACDLEKSLCFDSRTETTSDVLFPMHAQTYSSQYLLYFLKYESQKGFEIAKVTIKATQGQGHLYWCHSIDDMYTIFY